MATSMNQLIYSRSEDGTSYYSITSKCTVQSTSHFPNISQIFLVVNIAIFQIEKLWWNTGKKGSTSQKQLFTKYVRKNGFRLSKSGLISYLRQLFDWVQKAIRELRVRSK